MNVNLGLAALLLLGSYVCGAVPTSYLVAKWFRGIDLREHGSKNLGATNLYRTLGWKFAVPVGLIDVAKGAIPVLLLGPRLPGVTLFPTLCGVMAVLGHVYSVFVGFKGGKGVATAVGAVLGLSPSIGLLVLLIWLGTVAIWRYSSAGALAAFSCLPVVAIVNEQRQEFLIFSLIVSGLIWFKHKDNIVRIWKGTESKIGQKKQEEEAGRGR